MMEEGGSLLDGVGGGPVTLTEVLGDFTGDVGESPGCLPACGGVAKAAFAGGGAVCGTERVGENPSCLPEGALVLSVGGTASGEGLLSEGAKSARAGVAAGSAEGGREMAAAGAPTQAGGAVGA